MQQQQKALEADLSTSGARAAQLAASCASLQEQLKGAAQEIDRGNQAMTLLQEQGRRLREKATLKSEVIRRQEALVQELQHKVAGLDQRVAACESSESRAVQKEAAARSELSDARARLQEASDLIANNQKVTESDVHTTHILL